jgi:hypothetical protein
MINDKLLIKEICIKLNLKIEMINDVLLFVESFIKSKTHSFSEEVILGSCIYLSSKINEDFKRVRGIIIYIILDIINVIYFVNNKYERIKYYDKKLLAKEINEGEITYLYNLKADNYNDDKNLTLIQTMVNLTIEKVNYLIK